MNPWLDLILLVVTAFLFRHFYALSLKPAGNAVEPERGWRSRAAQFRFLSLILLGVHLFLFYSCRHCPLPMKWLEKLPWPSGLSSTVGFILLFPAAYNLWAGLKAAGRRTVFDGPERTLFGGIYLKLRHPQFMGILMFLFAASFLANSPMMLAVSIAWGFILRSLIKAEDGSLEAALGEVYREYRKNTGAFITIERSPKHHQLTHCLNCNQELKGEYCYQCGQKGTEIDVPLGEVIQEFLRDELKIDARLGHTIIPLLFKPGLLTADYIAGRRVRYMPPLRMYVFISLVMFFLLAIGSRHVDMEKIITAAEQEADSTGAVSPVDSVSQALREAGIGDSLLTKALKRHGIADPSLTKDGEETQPATSGLSLHFSDSTEAQGDTTGFLHRFEKAAEHGWEKAKEDPEKVLELAVEKFGHIMFLLLPIFALLLKLLYLRRGRYFMQHLIFSLHFHAYVFFILSIILAINLWGGGFLKQHADYLFWLVPLYLLLAMKRFYGQDLGKTVIKFLLLSFNYGIIFVLGVALAFVFSLMSL